MSEGLLLTWQLTYERDLINRRTIRGARKMTLTRKRLIALTLLRIPENHERRDFYIPVPPRARKNLS